MRWLVVALLLTAAARGEDGVFTSAPQTGLRALRLDSIDGPSEARLGLSWSGGVLTTAAIIHHLLLAQGGSGVDVAVELAFRSLGSEGVGNELDARLAIGRSFGRIQLLANAGIGKGLGERSDVDYQAASFVGWRCSEWLSAGVEARVEGELVDDLRTGDDDGRAVDLTVGPSLGFSRGFLHARTLAGYRSPRGTAARGAALMTTLGVDF